MFKLQNYDIIKTFDDECFLLYTVKYNFYLKTLVEGYFVLNCFDPL